MGFLFLLLPLLKLAAVSRPVVFLNQWLVRPHARLRQTSRKGGIFVEEVSQPEAETHAVD